MAGIEEYDTMRSMTKLAALALLASAGPALAQATDTDTADVAINGTVTPLCVLGEPSQATVDLGQLINTSGSRVGKVRAIPAQSVTMPDSFCNFAGSVASIEATALVETAGGVSSPPAGFARAVNFSSSAGQWGGGTADTATSAAADGSGATSTGASSVQPSPRLTDIVVDLSGFSAPGDALLVLGDYMGLVRVTLGPAAVVD